MKSIRSIAAMMFFAVLFAVPAFAQQPTAAPGGAKVAIINSSLFDDEKTGITRYVQAFKTLETETKPQRDEIISIENRLKTIANDIAVQSKNPAVDPKSIETKQTEGQKLQLDYNYKQEQYKANIERLLTARIGPIQNDIGKAIQEYAKQKGYSIVFDIAKDDKGILIWADMNAVDMTADFIKFYNARPAGTAAAGTPK